MSCQAAPCGEVTTPIARGHVGQRALAAMVEEALGLEALAELLELKRGDAETGGMDEVDDELEGAGAGVEARRRPWTATWSPGLGQQVLARRLAAEEDAFQAAVVVAEGEVDVAGRGAD